MTFASIVVVSTLRHHGRSEITSRSVVWLMSVFESVENGISRVSERGKHKTPLQAACRNGHSIEVIQELLKAGAKVDLRDSHGKSALLVLLDSAHTDNEHKIPIVRLLLEAKCNVNVRVGDKTALFLACKNFISDRIFSMIVASGADLTMTTHCGRNALHLCIHHQSSLEKIRVLLQHGVNVNGKTYSGETPLLQAVEVGDTELISLLLHSNASITATIHEDNTALLEVLRRRDMTSDEHVMIIRLILERMNFTDRYFLDFQNDEGWTALHFAAISGAKLVIHELLNCKPDITQRTDDHGRTALHVFINNYDEDKDRKLEVLQCLVEHENGYHRPDAINQQDHDGRTALHLALESNCNDDLLRYLSNATNVRIPNKKGETALHTAVLNGHSKAVILVLLGSKHGGAKAANIPDFMGQTALHKAIFRYHDDDDIEIVRALGQVTRVNAQDRQGRTALHYAVERFKIGFVNILLLYEQNTNKFIQDYHGNTPLSLACKLRRHKARSQLSVIFQLYQYGVAYGEDMV